MSEVRTSPVRAMFQGVLPHGSDPRTVGATWPAGAVALEAPDDGEREQRLWWSCPCGCGHVTFLHVGNGFKPADAPSWHWNGSTDAPELQPSVHRIGHWHGWLRNGIWESC